MAQIAYIDLKTNEVTFDDGSIKYLSVPTFVTPSWMLPPNPPLTAYDYMLIRKQEMYPKKREF